MTDANYQVLARTVIRTTPLAGAAIVYPGADPAYGALAETLADAVERVSSVRPELASDIDLMPTRGTPLPHAYRQRTLILLGSLNSNRAVLPLYGRYLCATDATYPGGDGYDLRTLVNPYGTGANVILVGGSSLAGVRRAVECLVNQLCDPLPFLLDIELAPELARQLAEWPEAPLNQSAVERKSHAINEDAMKTIGAYGIMYAWTGDWRYGEIARDGLLGINAQMSDSYGDWHYRAERMMRVIPWLVAGGFLSDADILRTDQLLLGTALGTAPMWWRLTSGDPPLGHRHHGRGTFEFLLLARYLKEQANPNDALRQLCDQWIAESQAYLDGLGRAGIDDQDDESTLTNLATVFWHALSEERYDFFASGSARKIALRAIALHDNRGAGAGQGGYGEGFPGMMVMQSEATVPVAASAFYDGDGGLQWLIENVPHLKAPLISGFLHFSPLFMHLFAADIPATPPDNLTGVQVLPITPHQAAISTTPPEHIEYAGHSVEAPETWRRGEGIGLNTLPAESGFDKLVLRGGFAPDDSYLLLQGYQGGFRWQGHMQAANCIVRFSQAGHIFLIQNTYRHSLYQKNGLFISDGYNDTPIPPIAERVAAADFAHLGLTVTRLSNFHHADWTRNIFWAKAFDLFVVIDSVTFQQDGDYALVCTWRTPAFAKLDARAWTTRQGDHDFRLTWGETLDATSEEEADQGGAVPFVLRQRKGGSFHSGETISFQNLFFVRPESQPEALTLYKLSETQAYVSRDGQPFALCAIPDAQGEIRALGLTLHAASLWISADEIAAANLTHLSCDDLPGWQISSAAPVNLSINLATGTVDGAANLSEDVRGRLAETARAQLSRLQPQSEASADQPPDEISNWPPEWSLSGGTTLPKRLRDLTVTANPPPLDGFADQLVDTVIAEIRQTRQQWPSAENYEIIVSLADETPLDSVRIVGDSLIEPTLRTYHPLPGGITVQASSDNFAADVRHFPLTDSPPMRYKLFRDIEDQLQTQTAHIGAKAKQIRVRVPGSGSRPLVLHEIEVYGGERVTPPIQRMIAAELNGQPAALIVNAANELIALSASGAELWRTRFGAPVTHLSAHDLRGDGGCSVIVGVLGGDLHVLAADGTPERVVPLAERFSQRRDAYFGRVYTIHEAQIWRRDAAGRASLVIGGYSTICFLDADFEIVGHSWADGSWQTSILVAPSSGDLYVRSGWNHGVGVYAGRPDGAPSGETITFGGVQQPMFRGIRRVIPFANGKTVAYQWLGADILAAVENGVGILSTEARDWRWLIEGGTPVSACVALGNEIVVGGADGFIAAFDQTDGRPVRKLRLDTPVTGLAALGDRLTVATRRGLLLLDADWKTCRTDACPARMLLPLGDHLLVAGEDGAICLYKGTDDGA